MHRAFLLVFPIFFAFLSPLDAALESRTGAIRVRVVDPQGALVPNALVTLHRRADRVGVTEVAARGTHVFERLAPAEYVIEAEAPGFASAPAGAVRVGRGETAELEIALKLAAVEERIVVTASDTAQTVDEVSKSVTVLGREELERRDEFAVSESLRPVPGLRVAQLGGPGAFVSIKARGLRTEDTALLIDGVRFRDAASPQGDASAFLEDLLLTNVDRLEILRGSGSSIYGTNAIGAVINVVSREGGGHPRGSLLIEGGSLEFLRGRAEIGGGALSDRLHFGVGVSAFGSARGVDGDDGARGTNVQGRVRARLSPFASISAHVYVADTFLRLNESPEIVGTPAATGVLRAIPLDPRGLQRYETGVPRSSLALGGATFIPSANDPDNTRDAGFLSAAVSFDHRPADGAGYTLNYHALRTERAFRDGPLGVSFEPVRSTLSRVDGEIDTLQARGDWTRGAQLVTAGYEYESERFENRSFPDDPAENSSVEVTQRSHTFFVQDQLRLFEGALQIAGAFRAQFFTLGTPRFDPKDSAPYRGLSFEAPPDALTGDGSIAYFFRGKGTKLRAHVGNGYRAPSLFERFGASFSSFGYFVFGDPRLAPDRSLAFDAGVDQDAAGGRLRIAATYFHTWLREVIVFDFSGAIDPSTDPFGRFGGYLNTDGGTARGVELSARAAPTPSLDLVFAYTYTRARERVPRFEGVSRSLAIPDHQVSLVAHQRIGDRLSLHFDLVASTDYLAPLFDPAAFTSRAVSFDGILKADLGASYEVPFANSRGLRFFGKVENLLDREYYENGFRTPGATAVGGLAFRF